MLKNLKIRNKIILPIILTATIVLSATTIYSYFFNVTRLKANINAHLETAAQSKAHHIESFLEEQKDKIKIAAIHSNFTNEELKEIRDTNREFYEVFVLDSKGKTIASSTESRIGLDLSTDAYFINARSETYIKDAYFSKTTKKPSIAVSTPYMGGVLVARIDISVLKDITTDRTGLGETGEVYLINQEGYAITTLLFKKDTFLSFKVDSENAKNCLTMLKNVERQKDIEYPKYEKIEHIEHEASIIFSNYSGNNVLGTHYTIHSMKWCLLAEIDESEAMALVKDQLIFSIVRIAIALIIFFVITYLMARMISKPIVKLRQGTEIIEKGDLDYRVGIDSEDEIGQLSRSFDKMTIAIKKSRAEVDRKVEEQTKEIREQKEELVKILQGIGDGLFVINKDYKIVIFNPAAEKISGFLANEVIGKRYDKVLKFVYEKDDKINDKFIKNAIKTGETQQMENHTLLITKTGKRIPVSDSAAPLKDEQENVIGCVIIFIDISKEREVDRMKTEFVSLASHQLRTPLTAIRLFVEMLNKEQAGKLNKKQKEYVVNVEESTQRMIKLVNSLLNVSRLETGRLKINPKSVDLEKFISDIVQAAQPLADEKKVKIIFKKPDKMPQVLIDTNLMRQVVHNLIINAIIYSALEKGEVNVTLEKKEKGYLIKIKDNGIGIPKQAQPRIFQKFFRADNAAKIKTDGSGLGLYISDMVIRATGGKIWFESKVDGQGTSFYVMIPLSGMKEKKGEKSLEI